MAAHLHVILTLAFFLEVESHTGFCVDKMCFSVHESRADFSAAKKVCEERNGHLLTVRSNVSNSAVSTLLSGLRGNFWIGLQFNGACPKPISGLKGYKWITGEDEADFRNWDKDDVICPTSEKCVTVSTDDFKWRERSCVDEVDGFICEFGFEVSCPPVKANLGGQIQTYQTPFGFGAPDLTVLPMATVAELDEGTQYVCIGEWQKSPWSCEFLNGGCEHKCTQVDSKPVCTCPSGHMVEHNDRSCRPASNDPCKGSGCEDICLPLNESFICLCNQGFSLDVDGKSCKDIDDCADNRLCAGDHMLCENTHGSFKCICEKGFEMQNGICMDINECASSPCEHECNNTPGSYNCSCYETYRVSEEDRHRCILHCPNHECPAVCDPNEIYQCECPKGFVLDVRGTGRFCVDINECNMYYCDQHCDNSYGSYTCSCSEGYELVDGYKCEPIEGSGSTPSDGLVVTPTIKYITESPFVVSAGGILGIIVCVVFAILTVVLFAHHCMNRRGEHSLISVRKTNDLHDLEQITTENDKPNFSDMPSNGDR